MNDRAKSYIAKVEFETLSHRQPDSLVPASAFNHSGMLHAKVAASFTSPAP